MAKLPLTIECYSHNILYYFISHFMTLNEYLSLFLLATSTLPSPKNEILALLMLAHGLLSNISSV